MVFYIAGMKKRVVNETRSGGLNQRCLLRVPIFVVVFGSQPHEETGWGGWFVRLACFGVSPVSASL